MYDHVRHAATELQHQRGPGIRQTIMLNCFMNADHTENAFKTDNTVININVGLVQNCQNVFIIQEKCRC